MEAASIAMQEEMAEQSNIGQIRPSCWESLKRETSCAKENRMAGQEKGTLMRIFFVQGAEAY